MSMSLRPDIRIRVWATSTIFTCSPISSTMTSPSTADGGGLEDELAGLGDQHEEALDVGVGDRDRAAALDLGREGVHDRAARAEHVAEAHRHVAAGAAAGEVGGEPLGDPLAVAEHAGGVGGLVGGDVDEGPDADRWRPRSSTLSVPRTLVFHASSG